MAMVYLTMIPFLFSTRMLALGVKVRPHTSSSAQLSQLRTESYHTYDTSLYAFMEAVREVFAAVLEVEESDLPPLSELHTVASFVSYEQDLSNNLISRVQLHWNRHRSSQGMHEPCFQRFNLVYREFIATVIGPIMGGGEIIYQRAPGLRVHPPSKLALGKLHNDKDYHHQPSELNFWIPLTSTFGNNSLYVESEPDKGDFHPLVLKYGEFCKFYGNQCRHFTYPNNTNSTRVSVDFRVVSSASGGHDPGFHRGIRRGPKANFKKCFDIGDFYEVCDVPVS